MSDDAVPPPAPLDLAESKDRLRSTIRAARRERSPRQRAEAAEALADVVDGIEAFAAARCVAVYAARPGEPGTDVILDRLVARGTRVLLPALGAGLSRGWALYRGRADLLVRAPGRPPEPGSPTLGAEALREADVVLVPALAVDTAGARLGQGGGWYDRALAFARADAALVALVFPEEVLPSEEGAIPVEAHDRRVRAVATPQGWRVLDDGRSR